MNSERSTDRACAEATSTNATLEQRAVHLDIDGTMDLSRFSPPQHNEPQPLKEKQSRAENEAELRHVIRLQRQALNQQNQRIEAQRSLITRLNHSLKQMRQLNQKPKRLSWLRSLFIERKENKKLPR